MATGTGTITAAIYARLSDDKRKGSDDEGRTVAEQIADCRAFIVAKGWTEGKTYSENDVSATDGGIRPEFERLLADAPPIVVAWRSSRLSRDPMDTLRIKAAKMTGYLTDGGMIDFSSADAGMLTMLRSVIDQADGAKKAEFQKRRNLSDAKDGKWHYARPVFGNDHRTGALIPNEAEAIQKSAKALAAEETTFYKVSKDWNAQGFRTPQSANAGGKEWEPGTVRNFFKAPRLIGKRVYEGVTYTMKDWEPVLDEETFEQIQTLIEGNKTGKRGVSLKASNMHLLTGIARCGVVTGEGDKKVTCGKGMNIGYRGDKNSPRYYKCTTPNHTTRTAEPLERYVVSLFLYNLMHKGAEEALAPEGAKDIASVRAEKRKLEADLQVWLKEANEVGLSATAQKMKEDSTAEKVAVLDAQIMEHQKQNIFADLLPEMVEEGVEAMWKRWDSVDRVKQRAIVEALIASVVVLRSPQGTRFSGKYVKVQATPLLLKLNASVQEDVYEVSEEEFYRMFPDAER